MATDFIVGGVARDDDFVFHKDFVEDLKDSLKKDHVLLIAPRRTGKTSVMFNLLDYPPQGWLVVHLNVEELTSPAEFFISLIDAIREHQPDFFTRYLARSWDLIKKAFDRVEEISLLDFKIKLKKSMDWDKNWSQLAEQLTELLIKSNQSILFIVDEFPDLVISMEEHSRDIKIFLHRFRKMRQAAKNTHIRWLVGGSVNIHGTLERSGLINLINDFRIEILPPLNDNDISQFVKTMFTQKRIKFSPQLITKIQTLLGTPIALFLQLLTQELYRYWRRHQPKVLTPEHAEAVFNQALLGEAAHDKLQHYYSRIRLHYPESERDAAYALLNVLSQTDHEGISEKLLYQHYTAIASKKAPAISAEMLKPAYKDLLTKLKSDFYIQQSDDKTLNFGSHLLKLWWRKNWAYEDD